MVKKKRLVDAKPGEVEGVEILSHREAVKQAKQAHGKDIRSRIRGKMTKTYQPCPAKCMKGRVKGVKCNVCNGTGVVEVK